MGNGNGAGHGIVYRWIGALVVPMLLLAACAQTPAGDHTAAKTPTATPATPTATTATQADTPTASPAASIPYTFPVHWQVLASSPAGATQFVFAPSNPRIGYACTIVGAGTTGLAITHDGGVTWTTASNPIFQQAPCGINVDAENASDVFANFILPSSPSAPTGIPALYRSRDGGTTWTKLSTINTSNGPALWDGEAVVGGRIVAAGGTAVNPDHQAIHLYASDDGGASWHAIGQSIAANGQPLEVAQLVAVGSTLFAVAQAPCPTCGEVGPPSAPLVPNSLWRSIDAGATWTKLTLPFTTINTFSFTRKPGGGYYGIAGGQSKPLSASGEVSLMVATSSDLGTTWHALPGLNGAGAGYPSDGTLGIQAELAIAPDGTVLADTWHGIFGGDGSDAGVFCYRPSEPASGWQPYLNPGLMSWRVVVGSDGSARLWGLTVPQDNQRLTFAPMP